MVIVMEYNILTPAKEYSMIVYLGIFPTPELSQASKAKIQELLDEGHDYASIKDLMLDGESLAHYCDMTQEMVEEVYSYCRYIINTDRLAESTEAEYRNSR